MKQYEASDAEAFQPVDPVIYRMSKASPKPGRRAQAVSAAPLGELYSYQVGKFWVVAAVQEDGRLLLRTRRGKEHLVDADDPRLRRPWWWERMMYRHRFPRLQEF